MPEDVRRPPAGLFVSGGEASKTDQLEAEMQREAVVAPLQISAGQCFDPSEPVIDGASLYPKRCSR